MAFRYGARFLQRAEGLCPHAALADYRAHAAASDDIRLIGLFTNTRGRTGRGDDPSIILLRPRDRSDKAPTR